MSGIPYWYSKGIKLNINGKDLVINNMYCVGDRRGMHNSDELVVVTSKGTFNLSDDDVKWKLSKELHDSLTAREIEIREATARRVEAYNKRTPKEILQHRIDAAEGYGPARSARDAEELKKIMKYINDLEFAFNNPMVEFGE